MSWNKGTLLCDRCGNEIKSKQIRKKKKNSKTAICLDCFKELEDRRRNFLAKKHKVDFIN